MPRCLAIARSHSIFESQKNSLALLARALSLTLGIRSLDEDQTADKLLRLEVTSQQAESLKNLLKREVLRHQALVELSALKAETAAAEEKRKPGAGPWIERLDEYPASDVDLTNLVVYPPRLRPVPVKPIFLDVAWNYIDYPSLGRKELPAREVLGLSEEPKTETKRSGWFGFGGR